MEYDDFLNYFETLGPHFICGGDFQAPSLGFKIDQYQEP